MVVDRRANQKARTRQALLRAATELVRQGHPPSIPDAAELALVSTATAYRYFPTAQALWEEATFDAVSTWSVDAVEAAGDDVGARLEAAITTLGWQMLDDEYPFRLRVQISLERWFEQASLPQDERVTVREGRRVPWNDAVVAPLRGRLPEEQIERIRTALSLVWGPESVIVLRDVCRLDVAESKEAMLRAAKWLLAGALAEHGIEATFPAHSGDGSPEMR